MPLDSCLFSSLHTLAYSNYRPDRFKMVVRDSVVTVGGGGFGGLVVGRSQVYREVYN